LQSSKSLISKTKTLFSKRDYLKIFPKKSSRPADCQYVVHRDPDLSILPILRSWPHDPDPFITLPLVFTKHPNTGVRNIGMYRMQVLDNKTTGMHWHRHKGGAAHFNAWKIKGGKMPVAVVLGGNPLYTYLATAPLPENIDELLFCGVIQKKPVCLVKCISQDIEVPVDADIVIEGYVDTAEDFVLEGPFGDHTGFYSLEDYYPSFHVTAITHKRDAIYPATIVGVPPMEDLYFGMTTEKLFKPVIKFAIAPELIDFHLPVEGVAHNLVLLKIRKAWPGVIQKTMYALLGAGQMMFSKVLIAFPEDMDLIDYPLLLSHFVNNISSEKCIVSTGPADELEHASPKLAFGGKLLIDLSENPEVPEKLFSEKRENYLRAGSVLVISENNLQMVKLELLKDIKFVIFVDSSELFVNINTLIWWILANIDPKRDVRSEKGMLILDARHNVSDKHEGRKWPNPVVSSDHIISTVDENWESYQIGEFIESPSKNIKSFVKGEQASVKNA
jgi:4-hydroxy-3-polyprenylbenzoate decarboxylase